MNQRRRQPELMDAPDLEEQSHRQALAGLRRVNAISRSDAILWPVLRELAASNGDRPLRVLDLACGGGDVACRIARRSVTAGVPLVIDGCDRSEVAVAASRELAESAGLRQIRFFCLNVQQQPLPNDYDVLMCSLFLHHLDAPEVTTLLRQMAQAARRCLLANDLRRTTWGYALAWIGCRLLSRSPIVHIDGPRSVAGAYSCQEMLELSREAGLAGAQLTTHWPQRFLLRWDRS